MNIAFSHRNVYNKGIPVFNEVQAAMGDEQIILKEIFGYDSFRPGQGELVDAILSGRDVLGIMPTGAGKSICYQVPALCMNGITLVVSPLISLMKDQVESLVQAGVAAAYLNSSLTPGQQRTVLARAAEGRYKIMYVAPERLNTESFLHWACGAPIDMLTVDEAHCISQWGKDFRPGYLGIADFLHALPERPLVSAFTATATDRVRQDIVSALELRDPKVLVTGFDRPNLYFEVQHPRHKDFALLQAVQAQGERSGIVYCATRKAVEQVCALLNEKGIPAGRYHAGLEQAERQQNQDDFLFDRVKVMVATNAFGMGIDKSNVGYVIHYNMPKDLESYYQEAGRAGRDGSPASCILLYSKQDVRIQQMLIDRSEEEMTEQDPELRRRLIERSQERLRQMTFYCTGKTCLRARMLRYFGETAPENCGNCSICLGKTEEPEEPWEKEALSAEKRSRRTRSSHAENADRPQWEGDPALLARLKALRMELAAEKKVPAYVVFSDATLASMAQLQPTEESAFLEVKGVGAAKAAQYAGPFTECIREYLKEKGGDTLPRFASRSTIAAAQPPKAKPAAEKPQPPEADLLRRLQNEAQNDWPLTKMAKTHALRLEAPCQLLAKIEWKP